MASLTEGASEGVTKAMQTMPAGAVSLLTLLTGLPLSMYA